MRKRQPKKSKIEMECTGGAEGDVFVLVDGLRIARRGYPGTPQAKTWVSLEPGWEVLDTAEGNSIEVSYLNSRVHLQ